MIHLTSGSGLVVEYGLALFAFVDALISPEAAARWIPRWAWILFILAFPICGAILWICAGRPWRSRIRPQHALESKPLGASLGDAPATTVRTSRTSRSERRHADIEAPRPRPGADVDATLVSELAALNAEHEKTLRLWEDDLRRREAALREAQVKTRTA